MIKNSSGTGSMEQVRELLVGTQLKDIEQHCKRLEEGFAQQLAVVQENFKKRVESLENFMKSETGSLLHKLKDEQTERSVALKNELRERTEGFKSEQRDRTEALAQLAKNIAAVEETFERKLTALSDTLDVTERNLRQLLLSENARLSDKVDEKYNNALDALSSASSHIRNEMTSRATLSSLLAELAVKLSDQWQGSDVIAELEQEEAAKQNKNRTEKVQE